MMFNQSNHSSQITDYQYCYGYEELCSLQKNQIIERLVPYIYSIICILGFVGNSLVIVTCTFYKRTKSTTDVYLLNVAIVDLLFVLSLPLIVYNKLYSWSMGPLACKLLRGSYSVNLYSGMLLLTCISADRYIAIVRQSLSAQVRSRPCSWVFCIIIWVCALLLSVPTFYYYNWYEPGISKESSFHDEEATTLAPSPPHYVCGNPKIAVPSIQLAVGFFLPMAGMLTAICVTLKKSTNSQQKRSVQVVLAVMVVFIICHLPYNMTLLYDTATMFQQQTCETFSALHTAKTVTQTIAYLHCCLNPVLYAFDGNRFRNRFRRIFQDLWSRLFSRVSSEIYVSTRRPVDGSTENSSSFAMQGCQVGSSVDLSGPGTPGTEPEACQHLRPEHPEPNGSGRKLLGRSHVRASYLQGRQSLDRSSVGVLLNFKEGRSPPRL